MKLWIKVSLNRTIGRANTQSLFFKVTWTWKKLFPYSVSWSQKGGSFETRKMKRIGCEKWDYFIVSLLICYPWINTLFYTRFFFMKVPNEFKKGGQNIFQCILYCMTNKRVSPWKKIKGHAKYPYRGKIYGKKFDLKQINREN